MLLFVTARIKRGSVSTLYTLENFVVVVLRC